ncbi:hypothetical protein MTO96_041600 [Rhipicephalus appendiculatus]
MEATRKRARLENQAAYGPLVSLSAILDLAKETQRCVVEGEGRMHMQGWSLWSMQTCVCHTDIFEQNKCHVPGFIVMY